MCNLTASLPIRTHAPAFRGRHRQRRKSAEPCERIPRSGGAVVRNQSGGRELVKMRWGIPPPPPIRRRFGGLSASFRSELRSHKRWPGRREKDVSEDFPESGTP